LIKRNNLSLSQSNTFSLPYCEQKPRLNNLQNKNGQNKTHNLQSIKAGQNEPSNESINYPLGHKNKIPRTEEVTVQV
jgi:hypothetical protein